MRGERCINTWEESDVLTHERRAMYMREEWCINTWHESSNELQWNWNTQKAQNRPSVGVPWHGTPRFSVAGVPWWVFPPETPALRQALPEQTRPRKGNPMLPPDFFQFRYSTSYSMNLTHCSKNLVLNQWPQHRYLKEWAERGPKVACIHLTLGRTDLLLKIMAFGRVPSLINGRQKSNLFSNPTSILSWTPVPHQLTGRKRPARPLRQGVQS